MNCYSAGKQKNIEVAREKSSQKFAKFPKD